MRESENDDDDMQGSCMLVPLPAASSGGCHRTVGAFVWVTNSLILYAAHRGVVVYDVDRRESLGTLLGHAGVVTCVDAVVVDGACGDSGGTVDDVVRCWVVSGAADGTVIGWDLEVGGAVCRGRAVSRVETVGPVTGVSCCGFSEGEVAAPAPTPENGGGVGRRTVLVAVSSGDGGGGVRVLGVGGDGFEERSRIDVGTLVECVRLVSSSDGVGGRGCILAGGFVDGSVRLWSLEMGADGSLTRSSPCVLRHQHQNWVRAIDIAWDAGRKRMVMATASQDRYVRVWSFKEEGGKKGEGGEWVDRFSMLGLDAYAPKPRLRMGERTVAVVCEALLAGHEDWVHGARFHRSASGVLTLLTSSMDRTMMLWRREGDARGDGVVGVDGVDGIDGVDVGGVGGAEDQGTNREWCRRVHWCGVGSAYACATRYKRYNALFEAPRGDVRAAGCQKQCDSERALVFSDTRCGRGVRRSWLYVD